MMLKSGDAFFELLGPTSHCLTDSGTTPPSWQSIWQQYSLHSCTAMRPGLHLQSTHTQPRDIPQRQMSTTTETMLQGNRMRWLGHVSRIKDDRIQRQLLFCELACGTCDHGRPRKRSKDYWHKFTTTTRSLCVCH